MFHGTLGVYRSHVCQCLLERFPYLCLQEGRSGAEAVGQTRVVGAKSILLDLNGSHQEGIRFFELALSGKSVASAAVPGDQAIQTSPNIGVIQCQAVPWVKKFVT